MRQSKLLSLFIILITTTFATAQENEVGVFVGASAFSGDVIESTIDFEEINLGYGAFYRYYTSPKFSFKIAGTAAKFTGNDANSSSLASRGLSFESDIYDLTVAAEWNLLGINIYGPTAKEQSKFSPFFSLGVGGAYYNPTVTAAFPDKPLKAADLNVEYPKFTMVVPMGLGLKYVTKSLTIGLEGTVRAGLTDLLDGISKSGDSTDNDWYGTYGLSLAYRIGEKRTDTYKEEVIEEEANPYDSQNSNYYYEDEEEDNDN